MVQQYLLRGYSSSILTILTSFLLFSLTHSTLTLVKESQIHSGPITSLHFSSDFSQFVTVSSAENKFIIWASKTLEIVAEKTLLSTINSVGLNILTSQIIVLMGNGQVEIYDSKSLALKAAYAYPNSGYGNQISFISGGELYIMGGLDQGLTPNLHFFDKSHTYISSMPTTFAVGSQITIIYNVLDQMLFIASNESTAPVGIQMYTLDSGNYILTKKFMQSNAQVKEISISSSGSNLFTIAEDLTLRNYKISPFNNLYEATSVIYYDGNPLSVNGLIDEAAYVTTQYAIIEYFKTGQVSLETYYRTASPITKIINMYPILICTTDDGKMMVFSISFFDGIDKDKTKWVVLSSVMGGVTLVLLMGLVLEIRYNKLKERVKEQDNEGLKSDFPG